jgi:transketolase
MEGVASEAASLAGHLRLGKLIYLYDSNRISLAGETRLTFTEDVGRRFEAYGWHVEHVDDGNDIDKVERAIHSARQEAAMPSLIIVSTHIGYGSPHKQDTFGVHGSPLGPEEVRATKEKLGWPLEPEFYLPERALARYREALSRGDGLESGWKSLMKSYEKSYPDLMKDWKTMMAGGLAEGWDRDIPVFAPDPGGIATRQAGGKVMNAVAKYLPGLVGGSGDLDPSTNTALKGRGSYQPPGTGDETIQGAVSGPWGYGGANIAFGVREHAMGGICSGMALHGGLIPFASTFLTFSDYMRASIRLAALSELHVIYVFTHDSVALGEDGPTHQPVEHISSLRAMPNLTVIRPADANEAAEAWRVALGHGKGPVALVMTRQKVPVLDRGRYAPAEGLRRGAYVLADPPEGRPEAILIATGSEVHLAIEAYERLSSEGLKVRVVSMPSWELFEAEPEEYRLEVLPPDLTRRLSIEAGSVHGWHKYICPGGEAMGIDRFGASAPGDLVLEKFGFTADNIVKRVKKMFNP